MTKYDKLSLEGSRSLSKALGHFEYSFLKVSKLSTDAKALNDEDFETWEGYASRFSRVVDSANDWMEIRELRNFSAHDYTEGDLTLFFENIRGLGQKQILIQNLLK